MKLSLIAAGLAFAVSVPSMAAAQMGAPNGSELRGQQVSVQFQDGTSNTVYFGEDGTARLVSAAGREVPGSWYVQNRSLCLEAGGGARECWAYGSAFQAGQPMTLTSTCGTSQWTALSVNQPPMEPPVELQRKGERG